MEAPEPKSCATCLPCRGVAARRRTGDGSDRSFILGWVLYSSRPGGESWICESCVPALTAEQYESTLGPFRQWKGFPPPPRREWRLYWTRCIGMRSAQAHTEMRRVDELAMSFVPAMEEARLQAKAAPGDEELARAQERVENVVQTYANQAVALHQEVLSLRAAEDLEIDAAIEELAALEAELAALATERAAAAEAVVDTSEEFVAVLRAPEADVPRARIGGILRN